MVNISLISAILTASWLPPFLRAMTVYKMGQGRPPSAWSAMRRCTPCSTQLQGRGELTFWRRVWLVSGRRGLERVGRDTQGGCNEGDDVGGTGPSPAWRRLFPVFLCYIHLRPFQGIYNFPLSTDPLLCLPGSINLHLEATLNIIGLLSDFKNI